MKKFLSLVLAMIMTMSLVTISAGATEYKDLTDKDEIQYEEAVAVLNRIGVITGYDDGSFRPEGELTRGAAAKIIVSLLIGPEAANNLPNATAPYPDVPASHTFAGVISYCKTAQIISGYGDGTFKPGNSLTGFAFAKMLLGALGYKQEIEGFVDTGWTMNVAKVGNVVGLFDRLDFDGSAAVNREEACQLALNTLKATMVTYGGTTMVTGAQNMFVQGTQAMYVTSNNREINANINRRVISAANNELTLEFGEEHFKDLRLEHDKYDPAYDDYGHPSNEWSWKKVTIGTFKLPADFTYTNQIAYREDTVATKEKALGLRGYDTYSTDHRGTSYNWSTALGSGTYAGVNSPFDDATQITINGYDARANDYGALVSYDAGKITNKDDAPTLAEIADLTDNGVTVEVYVCPVDADFITNVVVTRTQMMNVKRIGSDYVTLERISPDSRDPRKDEAEKDSMQGYRDITGYNAFAIDVDTIDVKDNNDDAYKSLKDLKTGDKVAVIPFTADQGRTWEVGEAYVPETVSGKLSDVGLYMNTSKVDGNATSITVGGTKYVINEWNKDMIDVKKAQINATRKDVTAYLAKDGTVLWATEIGNSDDWMIVGDYYQAANSTGKVVWYAHGWTIGGEEVDIDLGTIRGQAEIYAPGELVRYSLANGGTGEYELGKPNNTGFSSWYSTDGNQKSEERLMKKVNNRDEYSGEGVYNIAQYVKDSTEGNVEFSIHPANSLIPLEDYTNYLHTTTSNTAVGGKIFDDEAVDSHVWDYRSTTYNSDGVKFIYVNFDSVTGNVDYVSVRKDAQTVENAELKQMNHRWSNVGTNKNLNWVISPAEAYVNKDGNVEAVVIKCEPAEADLSNVVIVGEFVGTEYGKTGAETSATNPSNVSAREYWQGPNFNEKKTGYFKNGHDVGDIVVIRSTDANGVMDCKLFNGGLFEDRNPDVFTAEGISALKSALNANSKIAFYVGKSTSDSVYAQKNKTRPLTEANAQIMTDLKVEAVGWDDLTELEQGGYKGLIKVSGAKWIDLRANRGSDEVENLSDLLDLDHDTVKINVLLNAKGSTDTFRRAYAVVVLQGSKLSQVAIPELSIQKVENATYAEPVSGKGTASDPWIFHTDVDVDVRLHGEIDNASSLSSATLTRTWTINGRTVSSDFVSDSSSIWVTAPEVRGAANGVNVTWTVTSRDDTKVDRRTATTTVYAKVIIPTTTPVEPDPATVTVDPVGSATIAPATGLKVGDTFTVTPVEGYEYVSVTGATKAADSMTFTITAAAVTVTMKATKPDVPETVKINVGTDAVTFHNADTDAVIEGLENVTGEVDVPTANPVYVTAGDGSVAVAMKNNLPYLKAFVPSAGVTVRVIPSTTPQIFGQGLNVNDEAVLGLVYDLSAIPAGNSGEAVESLTTMAKPQDGETPYLKVTLGDDVVLLRGVWDGYSWGYTFHPDTPAAARTAFLAALNAGEKITPAVITEEEYNKGYTTDPEPSEDAVVKASVATNTGKVTFSAYYGPEKDADAPVLTEDQIAAAIEAVITEKVVEVNLEKGYVVTDVLAHRYTFDTNNTAGSYKNPIRLFKVTVDGDDSFVTPGGTISGLDDTVVKYYVPSDTIASNATNTTWSVSGKTMTVKSGLDKDIELVGALDYTTGITPLYVMGEEGPVAITTGSFVVQKGATLLTTGTPGVPVKLTVNGETVRGRYDDDGKFYFTFGESKTSPTTLTIAAAANQEYDVYFNDNLIAEAVEGTKRIEIGNLGSSTLIKDTKASGLGTVNASGNITLIGTMTYYTVDLNDVYDAGNSNEIHLYSGCMIGNGGALWTAAKSLNARGTDLNPAEMITGPVYVKDGTKIYLKATSVDTALKKNPDPTAKADLDINMVAPTHIVGTTAIYEVEARGNVTTSTVIEGADLSAATAGTIAATSVNDAALAAGDVSIKIAISGASGISADSPISASFKTTSFAGNFANINAVYKSATEVDIYVDVVKSITAGNYLQSMTLTVDDVSTDIDINIA